MVFLEGIARLPDSDGKKILYVEGFFFLKNVYAPTSYITIDKPYPTPTPAELVTYKPT